MATPSHLKVRDARDRLIDLLGIGQTYPLRDVDVQEEQITVNFNQPSTINIVPGQSGVNYELYEGGRPVVPASSAAGNGGTTVLAGAVITGDRTFSIRATKVAYPERTAFLLQSASFKVGLNTKLRVYPLAAPALNPLSASPADLEPRVIDYGSTITIRVVGSQSAAQYRLEYPDATGAPVATSPIMGTGGDIDLLTSALTEDTQLRVRVTRTFDPAEGRTDLSALLDAVLTIAVRANPAVAVAIDGSAVVDPTSPVTMTVLGSQKSAVYSAYLRPLRDPDFEFNRTVDPQLLRVSVPDSADLPAHTVFVRPPPRPTSLAVASDYVQQGELKAGSGAALKLNLGTIHDDSVLLIQARKDHQQGGRSLGQSAVQLAQPLVVLTRPDPAAALVLTVSALSPGPGGTMLVTGGQLGVFYHFRLTANTAAELALPAYFHRLDEQDPQQNRGVEQLRVGTDLAIARTPPLSGGDLTRQRPLAPLIDLAQIPADTTLSVTAVWARTGVAWLTPRPVTITKT